MPINNSKLYLTDSIINWKQKTTWKKLKPSSRAKSTLGEILNTPVTKNIWASIFDISDCEQIENVFLNNPKFIHISKIYKNKKEALGLINEIYSYHIIEWQVAQDYFMKDFFAWFFESEELWNYLNNLSENINSLDYFITNPEEKTKFSNILKEYELRIFDMMEISKKLNNYHKTDLFNNISNRFKILEFYLQMSN